MPYAIGQDSCPQTGHFRVGVSFFADLPELVMAALYARPPTSPAIYKKLLAPCVFCNFRQPPRSHIRDPRSLFSLLPRHTVKTHSAEVQVRVCESFRGGRTGLRRAS
jgi:hypothetical protein